MSDYTIRKMEKNDLPFVYEIQIQSFGANFVDPIEKFENILSEYPLGSFVVEQDGTIMGYSMIHPADDAQKDYYSKPYAPSDGHTCLYIYDLCISPAGQGKGFAKALFSAVEVFAKETKFKKLIGVAVQDAAPFWERFGFEMLYPHRYNGEDGQFMQKDL